MESDQTVSLLSRGGRGEAWAGMEQSLIPWPTLTYPERLRPPGLQPRWRPIARRLNIHYLLLSTILFPRLLKPWTRCVLLAWPLYHPWERTSTQCPVMHVRPPTSFSG